MSPNAPKTPIRGVRVPTPLWLRAQDKARERGDNLSEVMREALERYVAPDNAEQRRPDHRAAPLAPGMIGTAYSRP